MAGRITFGIQYVSLHIRPNVLQRARAYEEDDPKKALNGYLDAIATDPTIVDSYLFVGNIYLANGDHAAAYHAFNKAAVNLACSAGDLGCAYVQINKGCFKEVENRNCCHL
jgi:Tfp pilus assembly protein PilF